MKQILDQLLSSGKGWLNDGGDTRKAQMKGMAQGGLAAGAMALLLGNKKMRKYGTKVAAVGGAAALGGLAYKLYQDWQAQQSTPAQPTQPLGTLEGNALDARANLLVRAMVAAARADGHIDAAERQKIQQYLTKQGQGDAARWIDGELSRPLDPQALAREVTDMELATEVYLASLLAIEVDHFMERGYLDELARALKLDDNLKGSIERQVAQLEGPG
ncbi:tellurite resistance TerB family protein [Aeromonas sp. SrichE-2G]|uniref:tellurite resistance TerB family protein n=1 Tax=Aeromonas sp. SrichE-2G TaxID=2823359 RepID=UPI001B33B090|nr:tellurite resistance TerB family protein [Aeromonas sp. SrichE-2G]MBP4040664.1 tellurite resistance TerB family protein [Aeromonas sp. SrichE-2G]